MNHQFRGWTTVFGFTFRQGTKIAGFKFVTILMAVLILIGGLVINLLDAKPDDAKEMKPSAITKVYISDQSGLEATDFAALNPAFSTEQYKHIQFETTVDASAVVIKKAAAQTGALAIFITTAVNGYKIEAVIPDGATINEKDANELLKEIAKAFESSKMMQSGLTSTQLSTLLKPVLTTSVDVGESKSMTAELIKMIAPMVFSMMLYIMLLLYGQKISNSVSTEKVSKLLDTLLISAQPYALITGKVLAVTAMAFVQFSIWIAAVFAGLYGGNAVAHAVYPTYESTVVGLINFIKENIGQTALSLPSVFLAILVFGIGFLFYAVIAAFAGCMVTKPEDVASTQAATQIPIIVSWLICYLSPFMDYNWLPSVLRFIPLTAPFCVPVDLLTGTIGIGEGILAIVVLSLFTFVMIVFSARIYKGLVLFHGQKVSLKTIKNILIANR